MGRRTFLSFFILSGILILRASAEERENSGPISNGIADPPADDKPDRLEGGFAEAPGLSRKLLKHHSSDKSVAGGGVIIGGLITAIFAAVYCYIRVTRRPSSTEGTAVPH